MTNEFEYSDIDDEQLRKAMPYTEGIVRDAILSLYDRLIKSDYALTTYMLVQVIIVILQGVGLFMKKVKVGLDL